MKPKGPVVLLSALKLNPKNPRSITEAAFKKLCDSIKKFPKMMALRGIVVDKDGTIIGGTMRYKACLANGLKEVPAAWVKYARDLTAEERKRFIIEDNAPFGGEWDYDMLANEWEIKDLLDFGFDPKEFGIEEDVADAEPKIDNATELNKKWKVKRGDCFKIGDHHFLLCGDATSKSDAESLMRDTRATLVFTDPPYGVSISKKNAMLKKFRKSNAPKDDIEMDDMKPSELGDMLLKSFSLWREFMADDCSVFVCSPQGGGLGMMMMMMKDAGLEVKHVLNWVKNHATFSLGRLDYDYQHEPILFTWKKTHKRKKAGEFQTSLWTVDKPHSSKDHPTIKPVELPTCAILNHTDQGDVVVDMFLGSGTTMVACQNTGRKCRGIEISPDYCAVILERMSEAFPGIEIKKTT